MVSVKEALELILENTDKSETEKVSLIDAIGSVLRQDWSADRDFPPFDRVTMDGIALRYADISDEERTLTINGVIGAGTPQADLPIGKLCYEVMTGAILPKNTDMVIRYEELEIIDN